MAENYEEIKNEVKEKITLAGLTAVAAKGTVDFDNRINDLLECIRKNYLNYLLATYKISYEKLVEQMKREENIRHDISIEKFRKRIENLLDIPIAIYDEMVKPGKRNKTILIKRIVAEYKSQGNQYDFFNYLNSYCYHIGKNTIVKRYFEFKRHGSTIKSNENKILSKCYNFLKDKEMEDFNENTMIEFASKNKYKIETVKEIWIAEKKLNFESLDSMFYDNEGNLQKFDISDISAEEKYEHIETGQGDLAEFDWIIKLLNTAYYKDFTANMQRCYPYIFTSKFIKNIVEVAKEKIKARSNEEMKRKYWDKIDLVGYRDTYAIEENVCVKREEFDWSIENHDYRTRKAVAKLLGVSQDSIKQTDDKVIELLKRKVAEKQYAE